MIGSPTLGFAEAMRREQMPKAVVICSGGLDSTTLLYFVRQDHEVEAVGFDYGQRHRKELEAMISICRHIDVPYTVKLAAIGHKGSVSGDEPVPHGHYAEESMKSTIVPNRNMVMIALAASHATTVGATKVFYGAHHGDHAIYPDCRPEFVEAMNKALLLGNLWENNGMSVRLEAPFINDSKADIVRLGTRLGVPFEKTWSCYEGGAVHCGLCGTCQERKEAFKIAGVPDPTAYKT